MKVKAIRIACCRECPHHHLENSIKDSSIPVCSMQNPMLQIRNGCLIPNWCPLEDLEGIAKRQNSIEGGKWFL
jgi:hypothetical protein